MPETDDDLSRENLVSALEANLYAHSSLYSHLPGAREISESDLIALMTSLDPSGSCIYRAVFPREQADDKIQHVLQRFRSADSLPMWWIVGPSTKPADLGMHLEARGFRLFARPPGMALDLSPLSTQSVVPNDLFIERVTSSARLMQWTEIVATVDGISESLKTGFGRLFGRQGFGPHATSHLFLGTADGRPVATSRLFLAGGLAGIYHVATLPEARGRGYATAMTLTAARAGREYGCRVAGLFATPAGYGMYRRLGFREYCRTAVYKYPP